MKKTDKKNIFVRGLDTYEDRITAMMDVPQQNPITVLGVFFYLFVPVVTFMAGVMFGTVTAIIWIIEHAPKEALFVALGVALVSFMIYAWNYSGKLVKGKSA